MAPRPGKPLPVADVDFSRLEQRGPDMAAVRRSCRGIASLPPLGRAAEVRLLLTALGCLDLTDLSATSTEDTIRALGATARRPLPPVLEDSLGAADLKVAAMCVYPSLVPAAAEALAGSGVRVAAAAGGFPDALSALSVRVTDVETAINLGADEVDVPVNRGLVIEARYQDLYAELVKFRTAAPKAIMKVILCAGDLPGAGALYRTAWLAMAAGADFLKTSTGREATNATLSAGAVMGQAILAFEEEHGRQVGLKPAGGLKTPPDALDWLALTDQALGPDACQPHRFRIGASSLAQALVERLAELDGPGA
ncbi:MAG: 2-deoxyribose-5-phosphate aldolase [Anaerolineae bacterium]